MWNKIKNSFRNFRKEEDGVGVVELILILVVLVGLVVIFKGAIEDLVTDIITSIQGKAETIYQ